MFQEGLIQDPEEVYTFKLHESHRDASPNPTANIMQFSRENKFIKSHKEDLSKLPENVHFHHKKDRMKYNNHDKYSSEDAESIFGRKEEQNTLGNYFSHNSNFKFSSDYDADVEDINVETNKNVEGERNCVNMLCDLFDEDCKNSNNKDLSKLMESLFSDTHSTFARNNKTPRKKTYSSKEKLDIMLEGEGTKNSVILKHRHKRASFIIPQLAVVIPMMDHEEYGNEDLSKKLKRCLKKSCHTRLCHKMGCYEDNGEEPLTSESYENEYNPPQHPKKVFSQSYNPTIYNHNTNTNAYSDGNVRPVHKLAPWQRAEIHQKNDPLRSKFHEVPSQHKERNNEENGLLRENHGLNDDESAESSVEVHLQDCAERLKQWINMHWESKRNKIKPQQLSIHKHEHPSKQEKARANFHEQIEIPRNFELQNPTNEREYSSLHQPKQKVKSIQNYGNEYLSVPTEKELGITPNTMQENKFDTKNENNWLSVPYEKISSNPSENQKHENKEITQKDNERIMSDVNSKNNLGNNKLYSLFPTNYNKLHHIQPDNLKSQPRALENLHEEPPKENVFYNKETKSYPLAQNDSESFDRRFVSSADDDEFLFPAKVIEKLPAQHLGYPVKQLAPKEQIKPVGTWPHAGQKFPAQLAQKEHYSQHSSILPQVNLQEIYKNLPNDIELSAGQWIHLKPMERNKIIQPAISNHHIIEKPKPQYNKGMQDLTGNKYRTSFIESPKSSENIPQEFMKIPEISITTVQPNEFNTVTDGFQRRTVDNYNVISHVKDTPSEEKRKPAITADNRKYTNANVYLPKERNIPTHVPITNTLKNDEKKFDRYLPSIDQTHIHEQQTISSIAIYPTIDITHQDFNKTPHSLEPRNRQSHEDGLNKSPYEIPQFNKQNNLLHNATDAKVLHEQPSDKRYPKYEFPKFNSDTETIPEQATSDDVSSVLKISDLQSNINTIAEYYSTERTFKNGSDGGLDYSQNKSTSMRSSSDTTADEPLQKNKTNEYDQEERRVGTEDLQPYSKPIVYPNEDYTFLQHSQTSESSAPSAAPTQEGVSGTKITPQSGLEDQTYMQTDPEEGSQTHYIWREGERGIPLKYPTHHGSSNSEIIETKGAEITSGVDKISHSTERHSMQSDEHMTGNRDKILSLPTFFEQKERKSFDYNIQTNNLQSSISPEQTPTTESMSEYSGTLLIVDQTTGTVTESIPVVGRVLTARSKDEIINERNHDVALSSYQPYTYTYFATNSPITCSEASNTVTSEDNLNTLAQDISKSSHFSIEIFNPKLRVHSEQYKPSEFEIPKTSDHSTQTETLVSTTQMDEDNKITPSPLRMSLESSLLSSITEDVLQTNKGVQVKLPDLNITCLPHAKDPPCELAQNDVYRNFFTVMLNEMQRVGQENCSQNCTGTKIVPACEQCIKNLINRKINDHSMDEEVSNFAAKHCPPQEETNNSKTTDFAGQSSGAPYVQCKYKFIADLTSLFGLWLKAITNSR